MAYTEFKKRSDAFDAIAEQYPHHISIKLMPYEAFKKLWNLGEENFGKQGLMTSGQYYQLDLEARWVMDGPTAFFKKESDAVMMFFLIDRLKMDQMAAT